MKIATTTQQSKTTQEEHALNECPRRQRPYMGTHWEVLTEERPSVCVERIGAAMIYFQALLRSQRWESLAYGRSRGKRLTMWIVERERERDYFKTRSMTISLPCGVGFCVFFLLMLAAEQL